MSSTRTRNSVALVDIDGCLVQDGRLNEILVNKLLEYDQVILFTQRSMYLQIGAITRAHLLNNSGESSGEEKESKTTRSIATTPDVVAALEKMLGKPVTVSTSVDEYFGNPTGYYKTLSKFENALNKAMKEQGDRVKLDDFNEQVKFEAKTIKDYINKQRAAVPNAKLLDDQASPDKYYPTGKIDQYNHLVRSKCYDKGQAYHITYFDDSPGNIDEIKNDVAKNKKDHIELACALVTSKETIELRKEIAAYVDGYLDKRHDFAGAEKKRDLIFKLCPDMGKQGTQKKHGVFSAKGVVDGDKILNFAGKYCSDLVEKLLNDAASVFESKSKKDKEQFVNLGKLLVRMGAQNALAETLGMESYKPYSLLEDSNKSYYLDEDFLKKCFDKMERNPRHSTSTTNMGSLSSGSSNDSADSTRGSRSSNDGSESSSPSSSASIFQAIGSSGVANYQAGEESKQVAAPSEENENIASSLLGDLATLDGLFNARVKRSKMSISLEAEIGEHERLTIAVTESCKEFLKDPTPTPENRMKLQELQEKIQELLTTERILLVEPASSSHRKGFGT